MNKRVITWAAAQRLLNCESLHHWHDVQKVERVGPKNEHHRHIKNWRTVMERWFLGDSREDCMRLVGLLTQGNERDYIKLSAWTLGYVMRFPRDDDPFDVAAVRERFSVPLIDPDTKQPVVTPWEDEEVEWHLAGTFDVRGDRLLQHKLRFASIPYHINNGYLDRLRFDQELNLLAYVANQLHDLPISTITYDIVQHVERRPYTSRKREETVSGFARRYQSIYTSSRPDRTAGELFVRHDMPLNTDLAIGALRSLVGICQRAGLASMTNPIPNRQRCFDHNRTCQYYDLCHADAFRAIDSAYQPRAVDEL